MGRNLKRKIIENEIKTKKKPRGAHNRRERGMRGWTGITIDPASRCWRSPGVECACAQRVSRTACERFLGKCMHNKLVTSSGYGARPENNGPYTRILGIPTAAAMVEALYGYTRQYNINDYKITVFYGR